MVIAAYVWGRQWHRQHVLFRSDYDSVVHILLSRTSKIPSLMHLLPALLLAAASHSFSFSAQHIPGVTNSIADALSHFIGRIFTVWHQKLILIPLLFHHSCWRTSSLYLRGPVLFLFGSGPCSIYSQILCYSSVPVCFLLPPVGQDPLVWVSLPS